MPLKIVRQDMTKMCVDAIVNTTNEKMIGYSGVDLAVHTCAGPLLDAPFCLCSSAFAQLIYLAFDECGNFVNIKNKTL